MTYEEAKKNILNMCCWCNDDTDDTDDTDCIYHEEKRTDLCEKCEFYFALKAIEKQILNEADGCTGCAFESYEEWEMPCEKCRRNNKDYWRAKA